MSAIASVAQPLLQPFSPEGSRAHRIAEALVQDLRARKPGLPLGLVEGARRPGEQPGEAPGERTLEEALLLPGSVVELSALPGGGGLTCALWLLRAAQQRARAEGRSRHLCIVDPSRALCAPAIAALGVPLAELIVLQPDPDRLLRIAVRAQRSGVFSGLLVDATGLGDVSRLDVPVRRLALACEETGGFCALLTSSRARRGLPLPTAARALVEAEPSGLSVRFLKHKHGLRRPVRIRAA
jgi:hypothetical protein